MLSRSVLDSFIPLLLNCEDAKMNCTGNLALPKLKRDDLLALMETTYKIFNEEPSLLYLSGDFIVVGDIHGNLRDLLRIFNDLGTPANQRYIFMGDYVDRGNLSVEVVVLLLSYKIAYPENIYMIRGNHEFEQINEYYGFKTQVIQQYDEEIFDFFNKVFAYLPIAAVVNNKYFLVHGGISPKLQTLDQIKNLKRPITSFTEGDSHELVCDLLWSDPSYASYYYSPNPRGFGVNFGVEATFKFLTINKLYGIIRAHQCITTGVEEHFGGRVITVFSSSYYSPYPPNASGAILITSSELKPVIYKPLPHFQKNFSEFKWVQVEETIPLCLRRLGSSKLTNRRSNSLKLRRSSHVTDSSHSLKLEKKITIYKSSTDIIIHSPSADLLPINENKKTPLNTSSILIE